MVVQHLPQQRRKRCERREVDTSVCRHTHLGAGCPVEHPRWDLIPAVRFRTAQAAAKYNPARPVDRCVNADLKTKPRMPSVQQFSKLGSVHTRPRRA
jgi:hypothetical protein